MLKTKKQGLFMVISGPSGAGKGTICKKLIEDNKNIWLSISMTTREKREGEIDGKDYFFVSKEEFETKIKNNAFLECAKVHSNQYYGTLKDKVFDHLNNGEDVILEIDIQGALKVKTQTDEAIYIFIMPPSMRELKTRLIKRGTETKEQIVKRFKDAYQEINEITKYNYVVINDNLKDAVKKVEAIIMAEKCRVDRIEDFDLNSEEELIHELLTDKIQ